MDRREVNRKIAEKLGWRERTQPASRTVFAEDDEWCVDPITEKYTATLVHIPECSCPPNVTQGACILAEWPDFHSPAVFWVEFEKWRASFEVNRPGFGVREEGGNDSPQERDYQFSIEVWVNGVTLRGSAWKDIEASSKTSITEAGCRAWLAALALGEGK